MPLSHDQKAVILTDLNGKFEKAQSVFFAEYKGISVKQMSKLRNLLREKNAEFKVSKRTLLKIASKKAGISELPDETFPGTVGATFSYGDQLAAAKILHTFIKEAEQLKLLGGIMEGRVLSAAEVKQLAMLPGKEELLAKLVGSLKSPISGFHAILHGVLRSFVGTVAALQDKMAKDAPAPAAQAPVAQPEPEVAAAPSEPAVEAPAAEPVAEAPAAEETPAA